MLDKPKLAKIIRIQANENDEIQAYEGNFLIIPLRSMEEKHLSFHLELRAFLISNFGSENIPSFKQQF